MTGLSYENSPYAIRDDLVEAHRRVWDRFANAGTWLDGATRVQVAAEARQARGCTLCARQKDAMSPFAIDGRHDTLGELSEKRIDLIHRVVADPGRLTRSWSERLRAGGMPGGKDDTAYVEIVSIIAHVTAIDTFARALGLAQQPLPAPRAGAPSRYRPAEARQGEAWLPNIAWDDVGPNEADFCKGRESSIRRALTLVPDEARSFFDLVSHQYLPGEAMQEFTKKIRAITRAQIELLAGRVSALKAYPSCSAGPRCCRTYHEHDPV
ncbi:MAG: alkylhydroperoxidase-related (seleno)protein, partial [Proteobacteria bacterium]|nr:alkylhydroperoxidase-related (seleno)protein [Pseudomonadota bacterium]